MRRVVTAAALLAVVCLAGLSAAAVAPAASPSSSPSPAGPLYRIGSTQDFDGFDPFTARSTVSADCLRLCYDFLTWYKPGAKGGYDVVPDVARDWKVTEGGRVWTFAIRSGMTWHDGEPLTAADVVFTYDWVLRTRPPAFARYLAGVLSVQAPDVSTVVIRCSKPDAGMLAIAIPILPEHVWGLSAAVSATGGAAAPAAATSAAATSARASRPGGLPLVGSGPFRVVAARKGQYVKLAPNPRYPSELGGPPGVDTLIYAIEPSAEALVQHYKAGRLEAIVGYPALSYGDLSDEPGTAVCAAPALGVHELAFNCWKSARSKGDPLLRDVALREAIAWAVDRRTLVVAATDSLAQPATSLVSPALGDWHWDVPKAALYRYAPEKARQLLDDAGYLDRDGDGVREAADGSKLRFRLAASTEHPEDVIAAQRIVSWCADVGVELRLELMDATAFRYALAGDADFDLVVQTRPGGIDPGALLSTFTAAGIGDGNNSRYADRAFDRLYSEQAQAVDSADPAGHSLRGPLIDRLQALLYRDCPSIPLWYDVNLQAWHTDKWTGYRPVPAGAGGAPFMNLTRDTYIDLQPRTAKTVPAPGGPVWTVIVAVAAAVALGAAVVILRRRHNTLEDA
jgi:peptide/nickel transport system substrate-binding protein